jgi:3-hydroxyisobutyrate dehydrogenase
MKVGFIGLGVQGKHLAINIAKAGFDLSVFDVRRPPLDELKSHGAKVASSTKDIGAHGEIVCVCVLDDDQVRTVLLGADGVLAGAKPGTIVAVHSTIDPATIAEVAEAAKARQVELIDAPVSGSETGAIAKTMAYMVGGSLEAFEKCRPVFEASGKNIIHTGALGTGIRAKLAHQLIISVNMLAAYEGMRLGVAAGLAPDLLERVVGAGAGQSWIAERWSKLKFGPHAEGIFYKDLRLCLKFAHDHNMTVPGAALAQQLLDRIVP